MAGQFGVVSASVNTTMIGGQPGVSLVVDARCGVHSHRVEDLFRSIIRQLETGDLDRLGWLMRQEPMVAGRGSGYQPTDPSLIGVLSPPRGGSGELIKSVVHDDPPGTYEFPDDPPGGESCPVEVSPL